MSDLRYTPIQKAVNHFKACNNEESVFTTKEICFILETFLDVEVYEYKKAASWDSCARLNHGHQGVGDEYINSNFHKFKTEQNDSIL